MTKTPIYDELQTCYAIAHKAGEFLGRLDERERILQELESIKRPSKELTEIINKWKASNEFRK